MPQDESRIIKPPIKHVSSGRVFQPTNAFLFKKMLKIVLVMLFMWIGVRLLFLSFQNPVVLDIFLTLFEPIELLVWIGWEAVNLVYTMCAIVVFLVGVIYSFIYIRKIEYSVMGWSGDAMPEIYTRKGIINITKKHVPFRTIVNVRTVRGVFDRLFGIGSVLIETAGGSTGVQPTNLTTLLISKMSSSAAEEKIEGIRFDEELRDYILKEMRAFGLKPSEKRLVLQRERRKSIFTEEVLEAFKEVRDTLRESIEA